MTDLKLPALYNSRSRLYLISDLLPKEIFLYTCHVTIIGTDPNSSCCIPQLSHVLLKFWQSRWNPTSLPDVLDKLLHLNTRRAVTAHHSAVLSFKRCTPCYKAVAGAPNKQDSRGLSSRMPRDGTVLCPSARLHAMREHSWRTELNSRQVQSL